MISLSYSFFFIYLDIHLDILKDNYLIFLTKTFQISIRFCIMITINL